MANTAGLAFRRFDTISLIKILLCFYLTIAAPYSYAIDPITGAWTANAAASAAFGGGVSGGAAALTAAVQATAGAAATAATAAAAAAAVAGAGVAAFCLTSWAIGANSCGSSPAAQATGIPGALSGAGITLDPNTGNLVNSGAVYYTSSGYSITSGNICFKNNPAEVSNCLKDMVGLLYVNSTIKVEPTYANCTLPTPPSYAVCGNIQISQLRKDTIGGSYTPFPVPSDIYGYTSDSPATAEAVGAAVGSSPKSRAAAAAATAAPNITAAEAAAAAATAAPRTPEAECAHKGMKHGTFNGTVFCVGVGAGTDGTGAEAGETGTGEGTGTGTGEGTGNPPTTGTPPVSPPMPAFCTYAETLCNWLNWTKEEPAAANPAQNKVDIKDRDVGDIPGLPTNIDTTRIQWSQQCPSPISADFSLMGQSVGMSYKFDVVCDFAAKFRPYVIGLSYLTAAYIVMGLNRTRSE